MGPRLSVCRFIILPLTLLAAASLCGCAPGLPRRSWREPSEALEVLARNARAVRTVSAACRLRLVNPTGESVRLDGALAAQPPDRFRLQAWKMSHDVFDLTLAPGGLWWAGPPAEHDRPALLPAEISAERFAQAFFLLAGGFFEHHDLQVSDDRAAGLRIVHAPAGQVKVTCFVDQTTLTPRLYELSDSEGQVRSRLWLGDYRMIGDVPWPTHLKAGSDQGLFEIWLSDVQINAELPPQAFDPPRRAVRLS